MLRLIRLRPNDPPAYFELVARMHMQTIHHGVLPQLGLPFLATLYTAVSSTRCGFVLAAAGADTLLGFVAGTTSMPRMYAAVMATKGWRLLKASKGSLRHATLWRNAWHVLQYPLRHPGSGDYAESVRGAPELLAIAVRQEQQRRGVGEALLHAFEAELRRRGGYSVYAVATNKAERASNRFYRKYGFRPAGELQHHRLTLQRYQKEL